MYILYSPAEWLDRECLDRERLDCVVSGSCRVRVVLESCRVVSGELTVDTVLGSGSRRIVNRSGVIESVRSVTASGDFYGGGIHRR